MCQFVACHVSNLFMKCSCMDRSEEQEIRVGWYPYLSTCGTKNSLEVEYLWERPQQGKS